MVASPNYRLTDRDRQILAHLRTFRMTTTEVLQRLFFSGQDVEAVKSWTRRMKQAGVIGSAPFIKPRKYIYITEGAMERLFGETPQSGGPLTAFSLARQYGILAFCCLGTTPQRKLSRREFQEKFPNLSGGNKLPQDFYYVDKGSTPQRLGFIYVDHGSRAQRIHQRYRQIVAQRFTILSWRTDVIDRGRFMVAIVTAKPEKAKRIEEFFQSKHPEVAYRVEAVEDLIHLI